jgi:hypothetical protein
VTNLAEADRDPRVCFQPGRLWSLWDMLKLSPKALIEIGERMEEARTILMMAEGMPDHPIDEDERQQLLRPIKALQKLAQDFDMPVSAAVLDMASTNIPETTREMHLLFVTVKQEAKTKAVYFVPSHRAGFYEKDDLLLPETRVAFPGGTSELREAGNAYAAGLYTAAVLYSMRAAEIGARSLATALGCQFQAPLDQIDLHPMLEQCDSKINAMKNLPKSADKAEELEFYSTAASNFRYFKDGWRVRAAHARATFTEPEAERILTRTAEFFDIIAERLKE